MSKNPPKTAAATAARQFILPLANELVVDLFAGGGGASTGIEQALGRHVDIAINHSRKAVAQHFANHPQTRHYVEDVFAVDPLAVCDGQPIGLMWASPDCKHFSKAKGGKPVSKKIRGLAGVVIKWIEILKPTGQHPRVICLENVEEFKTWGPLGADGRPCPERKGQTFDRWVRRLRTLGYKVEWRELRACNYGTPTSRKRFFLVARNDGQPIVWPEATHAKDPAKGSGLLPWRTAADCIDWSIPAHSIFMSPAEAKQYGIKRPLAEPTMRRIAHGIKRYVLEAAKPFIVPVTHAGSHTRIHGIDEPVRTITTARRGEFAVAVPHITKFRTGSVGSDAAEPMPTVTANSFIKRPGGATPLGLVSATMVAMGYGERDGQTPRALDIDSPLTTVVGGGGKHGLVTAFMAQHNTGNVGHAMETPVSTIIGKGCTQGLVASTLVKLRGTSTSAPVDEPLHTISAQGTHHAHVEALLLKYYGTDQDPNLADPLHTITTKGRFALVTVDKVDYVIADIGLRMLKPRELYMAQGFPATYVIDWGTDPFTGERVALTQEEQIRGCGNSVPPQLSRALVLANYVEAQQMAVAA